MKRLCLALACLLLAVTAACDQTLDPIYVVIPASSDDAGGDGDGDIDGDFEVDSDLDQFLPPDADIEI